MSSGVNRSGWRCYLLPCKCPPTQAILRACCSRQARIMLLTRITHEWRACATNTNSVIRFDTHPHWASLLGRGNIDLSPAGCWNSVQSLGHFVWHWAYQGTETYKSELLFKPWNLTRNLKHAGSETLEGTTGQHWPAPCYNQTACEGLSSTGQCCTWPDTF